MSESTKTIVKEYFFRKVLIFRIWFDLLELSSIKLNYSNYRILCLKISLSIFHPSPNALRCFPSPLVLGI